MNKKRQKECFYCGQIAVDIAGISSSTLSSKTLDSDTKTPSSKTIDSVLSGNPHPPSTVSKVFNLLQNFFYNRKLDRDDFVFSENEFKNKDCLKKSKEDIKEILKTNLI